MTPPDQIVADSGLPQPIRDQILRFITKAALGPEDVDIVRELVAHFEDGLADGTSPDALLDSFGDGHRAAALIRQQHRPTSSRRRGFDTHRVVRAIRYSLRRMRRAPIFTLTAIGSLALAIGANTAIFTVVNAVVLRELHVANPDELVNLYEATDEIPFGAFSYPNYLDLSTASEQTFSSVLATAFVLGSVDRDGQVALVPIEAVSGNYFSTLGLVPALGRLIGPNDDVTPGGHPVIVMSHEYWQTHHAGSPDIIGQELRIGGRAYTVVGVAPAEYQGHLTGVPPALYASVAMHQSLQGSPQSVLTRRGGRTFFVKARRQPGVSDAQISTLLDNYVEDMRTTYPQQWDDPRAVGWSRTTDVVFAPGIDGTVLPAAGVLMVAVGLVLLVACTNLASFLLARAMDRRKELSVRLALGATRATIIGQMLLDSMMLAVGGGLFGVLIARGALAWVQSVNLPLPLPIVLDLSLDGSVLLFGLGVTTAAGLLFGVVPAMRASRADIASSLRDETVGTMRRARVRLRQSLVVGQVGVTVALLIVAGLFIRSMRARQQIDPGFGADPAVMMVFNVSPDRYPDGSGRIFADNLLQAVRDQPGIIAAGFTGNLHLNTLNQQWANVIVDGVEPPAGRDAWQADWARAGAGFFEAAGIDILEGREFRDTDHDSAGDVVIVNEHFARTFFDGSPLGRTIRVNNRPVTVIGVAAQTKVRTLGEPARLFLYRPLASLWTPFLTLVARTDGPAEPQVRTVVSKVRELDPELLVFNARTLRDYIDVHVLPIQLGATAVTGFAVLALIIAVVGLYGMVSFTVAQRTREVGIRMSLGANPFGVMRLMMRGGMVLVLAGAVAGLGLGTAFTRLIAGFLPDVSATDPLVFAGVPMLVFIVGVAATFIPARRATGVSPVKALRAE